MATGNVEEVHTPQSAVHTRPSSGRWLHYWSRLLYVCSLRRLHFNYGRSVYEMVPRTCSGMLPRCQHFENEADIPWNELNIFPVRGIKRHLPKYESWNAKNASCFFNRPPFTSRKSRMFYFLVGCEREKLIQLMLWAKTFYWWKQFHFLELRKEPVFEGRFNFSSILGIRNKFLIRPHLSCIIVAIFKAFVLEDNFISVFLSWFPFVIFGLKRTGHIASSASMKRSRTMRWHFRIFYWTKLPWGEKGISKLITTKDAREKKFVVSFLVSVQKYLSFVPLF